MKIICYIIILTFIPISMLSQEKELPKSKVDYNSFLEMSEEVLEYRKSRLIPFDVFLKYINDRNTVILDTRSEAAYKKKHLKGAIHINFSDFTEEKLAEVLPSKTVRILIYCNNNIDGDKINFASKKIPLALNIPTYINLYGYGYKNVYELSSLVHITNEELLMEGTEAE
ncbi:rhodanese-like domain-containing protein [Aquimarina sp. 2201CG5-10]|uniref:rhodanese-like domain-containing protein n=1 Tax=Aquimarina callyspongiae TaxID=3098150 RepID=UPI002AB5976C|nr:rhodanese-like domain-containing protein [Aquimarina sp. 2201CG5-10]MDY8136676.1 rhodanese-like domain-containing protein [Aquimarina sp. 2201CG5-10]